MEEESLVVKNWSVIYDKAPVIWKVSFSVPKGHVVGIIGPNGAGKSTLIKSLLGLVKHRSGEASFLGQGPLFAKNRTAVAYVPQRSSVDLDFPVTVFDVVLMGLYGRKGLFGRVKPADREKVEVALDSVGLASFSKRQISELSGGQQQKIFLARAIVQDAELYFLDEPFAGIDLGSEKTMVEILQGLRSQGKTIFIVHHDLYSVKEYFDWLILLNTSLIAYGPVKEVFSKENLFKTYGRSFPFLESDPQ